jgi:hypothetical protein
VVFSPERFFVVDINSATFAMSLHSCVMMQVSYGPSVDLALSATPIARTFQAICNPLIEWFPR